MYKRQRILWVTLAAMAVVGVALVIDDAVARTRGSEPFYSRLLSSTGQSSVDLDLLRPGMDLAAAQTLMGEGERLLRVTNARGTIENRLWRPSGLDVVVLGSFVDGRATQFMEVSADAADEAAERMSALLGR